jgi:hypothetical protein
MGVSMDLTDCVNIEQSGRAGRIKAKIGGDALSFEWEFGAAPVVGIIYVPSPDQWSARDPWRNLNRDEVLEALGRWRTAAFKTSNLMIYGSWPASTFDVFTTLQYSPSRLARDME